MPAYSSSSSHRSNGAMASKNQRLPDNRPNQYWQNSARPRPRRRSINYKPGYMVMLPRREDLPGLDYTPPENIDLKIFPHPALILAEENENIVIAIVTSHHNRPFETLSNFIQLQHLPIAPTAPAQTGEQLQMKIGKLRRPTTSYIKAHEIFKLPKRIIQQGNIDKDSGEQLLMAAESFMYVKQLVHEYQTRAPNEWQWRTHRSHRPFTGYSEEVFPPLQSPTSSPFTSPGSQRSAASSNTTSPSELSVTHNTPPKARLHDLGTAGKNGSPPRKANRAASPRPAGQLPPATEPQTWPTENDGYTPWGKPSRGQRYEPLRPRSGNPRPFNPCSDVGPKA